MLRITRSNPVFLLLSIALLGIEEPVEAQGSPAPGLDVIHQFSSAPNSIGYFVGLLDDINNDGCAEYLIVDSISPSLITVRSGADGAVMFSHVDVPAFNFAVLGDLNNDGISEYAMTTFATQTMPQAHVFVYNGASGVLLYSVTPSPAASIINAITAIDDIDGDGVGDFCVGAQFSSTVFVLSGVTGMLIFQFSFSASGFGERELSSLGDLNGDGHQELAVSYSISGVSWTAVYSLNPNGASVLYNLQNVGLGVSRIEDVDGDGIDDFTAGLSQSGGFVSFYSGGTGQLLWSLTSPLQGTQDGFGLAVASGADIDGDGFKDLIIAAPGASYASSPEVRGVIYVYSPRTQTYLFEVAGQGWNSFGGVVGVFHRHSLHGGADVNGDGFDDFIAIDRVGGYVRIYAGRPAMSAFSGPGNVAAPGGGTEDVLRIGSAANGPSSGGLGHTVTAPVGTPLSLWMAKPPAHAGAMASFALFGRIGATPVLGDWLLPFGLGTSCVQPQLLAPWNPSLFVAAETYGFGAGLLPAVPASATSPGTMVAGIGLIPVPLTVVLQGVVDDSSRPSVPISVTNAVRLVVY